MTIRTIIRNAATILGMNDVVRLVKQRNIAESTLRANQNFVVLFRCFNLMLAQVAVSARKPLVEPRNSRAKIEEFELSSTGLTYGVLAEYAFQNGMFNEARVWTMRFEQLLFQEISGTRSVVMPRWRR